MNSTEREQLSRFLGQLTDVRLAERDPEAERLIREAVARQPDAAYLLVQRAMLVEQALNAAKLRIAELQQARRSELARDGGSFLSGRNPWAPRAESTSGAAPVPGAGSYRIPGGPAAPGVSVAGSGGSSFLGNIATTAAGVVAGSFLYQGIENLLGHHHGSGGSWMEPNGEHLSEQTVINNYYGSESGDAAGLERAVDSDGGAFFASDESYSDDAGDDSDWI